MIRVVLDTNVFVSAFIAHGGNESRIFKRTVEGKLRLLISAELISELSRVMLGPKFEYSHHDVDAMVHLIVEVSDMVNPGERFNAIKEDPDDNKVLECAFFGKADYIVSGDEHLLELEKFRGIKIMKGSDFLRTVH